MQRELTSAILPWRMALVGALMPLLLLLPIVPVTDSAPLEAVHLHSLPLQGDQKPPDLWSTSPDTQLTTEPAMDRRIIQTPASQTKSISVMVPPQHITKPNKHMRGDPGTSRPEFRDKTRTPFVILGRRMKTFPVSTAPGVEGKITASTSDFVRPLKTDDQVTGRPSMQEQTGTENSSLDKRAKTSAMTTEWVRPGQVGGGVDKRARERVGTDIPDLELDRREKILKMLSTLEELYKAFNSTLSSRLTLVPRGNGRGSGKKGKTAIADGAVKTTAAPSTDSSGTAARSSTAQVNPLSLSGKAFKKSLPPPTKKGNKRVCFWKYCSQN
ncbi:urotensin II-related peptide [Alosa alosa]|uniref:urotensin II-related peptide n=1 Tax=Alosa alosa TaxID=278164 RepID=UPI0020150A17|nr:urotensin II-related peptide [Alosa alosa]